MVIICCFKLLIRFHAGLDLALSIAPQLLCNSLRLMLKYPRYM